MERILTEDIITEALNSDGIMQEPDAPWLLEYIESEYGGSLNNTSDWIDKKHVLKIYSESTADGYDIYWCTQEERPYVSQDGYYYEDFSGLSEQAIEEMKNGGEVFIESHIWDDMEYDFNNELELWWQDIYEELFNDKKDELLDSGDYDDYEE